MRQTKLVVLAAVQLLGLSVLRAEPSPRKLALLVGISKYTQHGPDTSRPWWPLHARKDIEQLRQVLIGNFGFPEGHIKVVLDGQATKKGIHSAFRESLIEQVRPGDIVMFHFSGHGQQIPDDNGDEQDGLDESLVPYDAYDTSAASGAQTNIRDDEVGGWLRELQARMTLDGKFQGSILITLDSCFSGTATRGYRVERGRGWDPALHGKPPGGSKNGAADGESGLLPKGEAERMGYVLLTASRSDQPAREADGMGIFSRALVKALGVVKPGSGTTMSWLRNRIEVEMAEDDRGQTPQLEGAVDSVLFLGIAPVVSGLPNSLLTRRIDDRRLLLPAGSVHGVTVGSVYSLFPLELSTTHGTPALGQATVESVQPFEAIIVLHDQAVGMVSSLKRARAVEEEHYYHDEPLRLYLAKMDSLPKLVTFLRKLKMVTTKDASAGHHDISVTLNNAARLDLKRAGAASPFKTVDVGVSAAAELEQILDREWRWKYISKLHHDDPNTRIEVRLVSTKRALHPVGESSCSTELAAGRPAEKGFRQKECFKLEFRNLSNGPRYITVLELAEDGDIGILYPQRLDIGNNLLRVSQPQESALYSLEAWEVTGRPKERSLLKLIATTQAVPFDMVFPTAGATRAVRPSLPRSGTHHPLVRLFEQRRIGQRAVNATPVNRVSTTGWSTSDAWLRIIE